MDIQGGWCLQQLGICGTTGYVAVQLQLDKLQILEIYRQIDRYTNIKLQILKELYTLISTLAKKLVLSLLNNKFELKILNSTPFRQKIPQHFRSKTIIDKQFLAENVLWIFRLSVVEFRIFKLVIKEGQDLLLSQG